MHTVSLFEAKTHLSRLVENILSGKDDQIIISRHGKPVARLTPFIEVDCSKRIGVARGQFEVPDDIDGCNEAVRKIFAGNEPA